MLKSFESKYLLPTKEYRCLSLLYAIHNEPKSSQKTIGEKTNLSSAMVNNYIKCFKSSGLITVSGKTNRTQSYHLTEEGERNLAQSVLSYSSEIVQLYAAVKCEIKGMLNGFYAEDVRTVVLFGAADTAEVVYAAIKETQLVVIGIVDSDVSKQGKVFNGLIIQKPDQILTIKPDAVLITSFARQEEIFDQIKHVVGDSIHIKKLSDVSTVAIPHKAMV
jgi:predicted transcriptional regulator